MSVPVHSSPSVPSVAGASSSASNPAAGGANSMELSGATTVSSMADLKKKSPKLYNMMMEGIAMDICNDMQHHQDKLKELMDEGRRNG